MKRPLLLICCLLFSLSCFSQGKKRAMYNVGSRQNPFLHQQWYIGLKGGVNLPQVFVEKSYSVWVPINYDAALSRKKYSDFTPVGSQLGLEFSYYFRGITLSVQPQYQGLRFQYKTTYQWSDPEVPSNTLRLDFSHNQKIEYVSLPLLVKYEWHVNQLSPFIQVGAYSNFLLNATKSVEQKGVDMSAGGSNQYSIDPVEVGAKDLFAKSHYGFIAGGGVHYNMGNIRLVLDVQYRIGRSNVNSSKSRYSNDRLSGIGDAMDDIKMNNLSVSAGALFPLRFLASGFKSFDK